jgi:hypothetical protein
MLLLLQTQDTTPPPPPPPETAEPQEVNLSLASVVRFRIQAKEINLLDQGMVIFPAELDYSQPLTSGTGTNQADRLFTDKRVLGPFGSEVIDLYDGSLTTATGIILRFVKVKFIMVVASRANYHGIRVEQPVENGFSIFGTPGAYFDVKPSGVFCVGAPGSVGLGTVVQDTGDKIQITNLGINPGEYRIIILGTSE